MHTELKQWKETKNSNRLRIRTVVYRLLSFLDKARVLKNKKSGSIAVKIVKKNMRDIFKIMPNS